MRSLKQVCVLSHYFKACIGLQHDKNLARDLEVVFLREIGQSLKDTNQRYFLIYIYTKTIKVIDIRIVNKQRSPFVCTFLIYRHKLKSLLFNRSGVSRPLM